MLQVDNGDRREGSKTGERGGYGIKEEEKEGMVERIRDMEKKLE